MQSVAVILSPISTLLDIPFLCFYCRANGFLITPVLSHYCRVCNIQLNSCRQAKIHSEGKKHCKRVNFLRLCIESGESDI